MTLRKVSPSGALVVASFSLLLALGPAVQAKRIIRVATWDSGQGLKVIQSALDAYKKANPGVDFRVESTSWGAYQPKLMTQMAAGQPPDVFMIGDVDLGYFAASGFTEPLNMFIKQDKFDLADMKKSLLKQFTYSDGRVYGLPKDYAPVACIYNKDLLSQAGLPTPARGWTWDQALEYGRKATKFNAAGKVVQNGLQMNTWMGQVHYLLNTFGTEFLGSDGKFGGHLDSKLSIEAMDLLCSLKARSRTFDSWQDFGAGKVAMMLDGPWSLSTYKQKKALHYGTQVPPVKNRVGSAFATAAWAVAANTKNKAAAWDVVKFLGGPKGHTVMASTEWALPGWTSVVRALKVDSNPDLAAFDEAMDEAISFAPLAQPYYSPVYDKFIQTAIDGAFAGKQEVAVALKSAVAPAQKEYDRLVSRVSGRVRK